jgi:AcrR family transcriptional regulator
MHKRGTKAKRGSYHHGDLRQTLLNATLQLIATEGARHFTRREVARRAGVSHAAPYRHFTDKTALLAAVAEEGFRALQDRMCHVNTPQSSEPLAQFLALGVEYVRFAVEHPSHFRVMFGPDITDWTAYPDLHDVSMRTFTLLVESITAAQHEHLIRAGDPQELALVAWAQVHGLATLLVDQRVPITDPEHMLTLAKQAMCTLYEGLRPR